MNAEQVIRSDELRMSKALDKASDRISLLLESYARTNHRFKSKTGNLARSTEFDVTAKNIVTGYIRESAPYGVNIVKGFKHWPADDYIANAVNNNQEAIERIIDEEISKELEV